MDWALLFFLIIFAAIAFVLHKYLKLTSTKPNNNFVRPPKSLVSSAVDIQMNKSITNPTLLGIINDPENSTQFKNNLLRLGPKLQSYFSEGGTGYFSSDKYCEASSSQKHFLRKLGLENPPEVVSQGQASDLISCNLNAEEGIAGYHLEKLKRINRGNKSLVKQMDCILFDIELKSSPDRWFEYDHYPMDDDKLSSYGMSVGKFWGINLKGITSIEAFNSINKSLTNAPSFKVKQFQSLFNLENDVCKQYKNLTNNKRFYSKTYVDTFVEEVVGKDTQDVPSALEIAQAMVDRAAKRKKR